MVEGINRLYHHELDRMDQQNDNGQGDDPADDDADDSDDDEAHHGHGHSHGHSHGPGPPGGPHFAPGVGAAETMAALASMAQVGGGSVGGAAAAQHDPELFQAMVAALGHLGQQTPGPLGQHDHHGFPPVHVHVSNHQHPHHHLHHHHDDDNETDDDDDDDNEIELTDNDDEDAADLNNDTDEFDGEEQHMGAHPHVHMLPPLGMQQHAYPLDPQMIQHLTESLTQQLEQVRAYLE
jgi:hypothetical protein